MRRIPTNERRSRGHGWAIAGGIAVVVVAVVVIVALVAGGGSSSSSSAQTHSISISHTTTIVTPTRRGTGTTTTPITSTIASPTTTRPPTERALAISALAVADASSTRVGSAQAAPLVGVGNLPGCLSGSLTDPRPFVQEFHATLLRVIVAPGNGNGNNGEALPCIRAAQAEGFNVMLGVQWASWWPVSTVEWWFSRELGLYGGYVTAVGVGNEQEIVPPNMSPAKYVRMWRAVEPIIQRMTPWAVRVGGEVSPWGYNDLAQELRLGLPGIQAVAVHDYAYSFGFTVAKALALARRYRLPLWCTEGLRDGPDSWPSFSRTIPLSGMTGVAMAAVWDRL